MLRKNNGDVLILSCKELKRFPFRVLSFLIFLSIVSLPALEAAEEPKQATAETEGDIPKAMQAVEINGDEVEFLVEENKMVARGNVVIDRKGMKLYADKVEFSKNTNVAVAEGHVILVSDQGTILGDKMVFNFETMRGDILSALIKSDMFYGAGKSLSKVGENQMQMHDGYITTCDLDHPHYRMFAKEVNVFPKDKITASKIKFFLGDVPLIYLPKYSKKLDRKPRFTFIPGKSKEWGLFMLTQYRYELNKYMRGVVHVDARERKDLAYGVDLNYDTPNKRFGAGLIRTYYMKERNLAVKHFYSPRIRPTTERQRFKVEWRHKWDIDPTTNTILQFYRLSDDMILKDYFEREHDVDAEPRTFFLLTKNLPKGTFSFLTEGRVNRYTSTTEKLPEIRYDLSSQRIGSTQFYFKNANSFANLATNNPAPSDERRKTYRLDSDNELSYPFKFSFIELRPFVGGRQTFYSRTIDPTDNDVVRGAFRTGSDLSTKFFKIFDVKRKLWGMEINRLRHLITPTIAYKYAPDPTILASKLDQYDSVDALTRSHKITFSLENKLQTKAKGSVRDFVRFLVGTDFALKEDTAKGGLGDVTTKLEFGPNDKLSFSADSAYDTQIGQLRSYNFDMYINGERWYFDLGKRYHVNVDDQITTEWGIILNPKWRFVVYQRYDTDSGVLKEQNYRIVRDLHEWDLEVSFNETRNEGDEILFIFRLKAFPEIQLDFGNSFNKRKAGSQTESSP
ncbi:MAG: hypothetical protein A2Z88_06650 [Omnitrophica WOR_2 bacterium GWA2_47_8]|nr:MAG: hypothetical protein A2Z88_06650 [Omnitrophica WOR_2 bacterium GWA2_47_8]